MNLSGILSTVFAGALVLAMPAYATDTGVLPGTDPASQSTGIPVPADSGLQPSAQRARPEDPAPAAADWLTAPPDPSRHSLLVPTAEWATCLALTIPIFMIDPAFVNVGRISGDQFAQAWTRPPEWDDDSVLANYVLHPIMGAEAYLTVRNRGYSATASFLFASGVSIGWEYLFEAWVERPSGQDLLITSPVGSLQGELRFQVRKRIAKWSPSVGRDALLILVDPVEALHRYIGKVFFDYPKETAETSMGSSLNVGPGQASLMVTLRL